MGYSMKRILFVFTLAAGLASPLAAQSSFSSIAESKITVRDLLEGHEKAPRSDTYYLLALADARKLNYEEAEKSIRTGLQINPRNTKLMNLRGAIFARKGRLAEARRTFLTVLQLDPDDKYAQASLSSVEKQLQPKRNSIIVTQKPSVELKPIQPDAPVEMIKIEPAAKKILEASYFKAIKKKQRCYFSMASIARAQDLFIKGYPERKNEFSIDELVKLGLLPSNPICPEGGSYSLDGKEAVCSKHGKQSVLGSEVQTVFVDFNMGMKAKLSRNYLEALKAFEQVVVLYPRWSEAHFQLADTLFRLGETEPAILELRQCLKIEPENLDAKLLLANLYFKKGQKQSALELLDGVATKESGTVYGLAARSIAKSIRLGRNYYQIFPPN
jgi:Flp pilus assembly protein TadD